MLTRRDLLAKSAMGLAGVAASSLLPSPSQAAGRIVCTCWGGEWGDFMKKEIVNPFEQRTNTKVDLAIGLSKDWIANLISAGVNRPPYDVVMTDEIWAADLRRRGFYAQLPSAKVPVLQQIAPVARIPQDRGSLFDIEPIGIAYRTDLIKTPPKSWKDLWAPEYHGKLGLYTITNTVGGVFLMLASKIWGGDPQKVDVGFSKIKELKPFKVVDFSGTMETLLTQGEVPIGVLETPAVARLKHKGVKVEYVIPSEGLLMFDEDVSVTSGSKNPDAAFAFVNHLLSVTSSEKFMKQFYSTPVNSKVTVPPDLRADVPVYGNRTDMILRWDYNWYNDHKADFIQRWNTEIAG